MLRAAIAFFILALVAMALGASGIAGLSMELGRTLLYVFLVLAVISFVANLVSGRKTNINGWIWLVLPLSFGLITGCSSKATQTDKALAAPSAQTVTAARQTGATNLTEVNFHKGSFVLTDASRDALRDMVGRATTSGAIEDLKVLAWADVDYPGDDGKKPSKHDRDLAEKRAKAIREYVQAELYVRHVDTYNMAERPNALQSLFNTSDASVKDAFENAGVTSAAGKSRKGRASHAVVMAMLRDQSKEQSKEESKEHSR